jgi:hypothetical protein
MLGKKKYHKKEGEVKNKKNTSFIMRDHSNDPFVVKKVETSRKRIEKYGFPKFD